MTKPIEDDIKKIACMMTELNGLAYIIYKPMVDDVCTRKAPESEVERLLDYMVGICNDDRITELFKRVCRKYLYLYPEMIVSEIYTYKDMYEAIEDDSTGADCVQVRENQKNSNMKNSERNAND